MLNNYSYKIKKLNKRFDNFCGKDKTHCSPCWKAHTHTHTHTHTLSHTHTCTQTFLLFFLSLSHTHTHTLSLSLYLSLRHTHTYRLLSDWDRKAKSWMDGQTDQQAGGQTEREREREREREGGRQADGLTEENNLQFHSQIVSCHLALLQLFSQHVPLLPH